MEDKYTTQEREKKKKKRDSKIQLSTEHQELMAFAFFITQCPTYRSISKAKNENRLNWNKQD